MKSIIYILQTTDIYWIHKLGIPHQSENGIMTINPRNRESKNHFGVSKGYDDDEGSTNILLEKLLH